MVSFREILFCLIFKTIIGCFSTEKLCSMRSILFICSLVFLHCKIIPLQSNEAALIIAPLTIFAISPFSFFIYH